MYHSCERLWLPHWNMYAGIMAGGMDQQGNEVSVTEIYYPNIEEWVVSSPLPKPMAYSAMVSIHGRIALIGGISNLEPQSSGYLEQ